LVNSILSLLQGKRKSVRAAAAADEYRTVPDENGDVIEWFNDIVVDLQ
jgi:hypothetical protein